MLRAVVLLIVVMLAGCTSRQDGSGAPSPETSSNAPNPPASDPTVFNSRTVNASYGQFGGQPLRLTPAGCANMPGKACKLASDFWFKDATGRWHPPIDMMTDGASIPAFAQPLIGGRYDPRYVAAAVVHDYYYNRRVRPYGPTQRQYYNASRALGTDPATAAAMYYAILVAGEAWVELEKPKDCPQPDATCVRNNPLPQGIVMKNYKGKLYATQQEPVDGVMKERYRKFMSDAKAMRSMTASNIEARAAADFPDNIVMQLGDRQQVSIPELTLTVMRARGSEQ